MALISTRRKSKMLIAAAALSQIGNFGAVVPDTNLAELSGSPRSSHTSLRLVGVEAKNQGAKGTAPVPVEEFDASELPAGWKITNTGTLDLPRATLNKDSYPGLVTVGVKGTYLSALSPKQIKGQTVDFGWTGRIESPEFPIERRFINFSIGGGNVPDETRVSLEVKEFDETWSKAASSTGSGNTGLRRFDGQDIMIGGDWDNDTNRTSPYCPFTQRQSP